MHLQRIRGIVSQAAVARIDTAVDDGARAVVARANLLITTGAVTGKFHEPSLPGEPPNNNWGTLRNNIEKEKPKPLVRDISSNAPYAAGLELGTSKMLPRPYMRPALHDSREVIVRQIRVAVQEVVTEVGRGK